MFKSFGTSQTYWVVTDNKWSNIVNHYIFHRKPNQKRCSQRFEPKSKSTSDAPEWSDLTVCRLIRVFFGPSTVCALISSLNPGMTVLQNRFHRDFTFFGQFGVKVYNVHDSPEDRRVFPSGGVLKCNPSKSHARWWCLWSTQTHDGDDDVSQSWWEIGLRAFSSNTGLSWALTKLIFNSINEHTVRLEAWAPALANCMHDMLTVLTAMGIQDFTLLISELVATQIFFLFLV